MSGPDSDSTLGVNLDIPEHLQSAAVRAVLWRVERDLLTPEAAYDVLASLGLVDFTFGKRPYRTTEGKLAPHRPKTRKEAS